MTTKDNYKMLDTLVKEYKDLTSKKFEDQYSKEHLDHLLKITWKLKQISRYLRAVNKIAEADRELACSTLHYKFFLICRKYAQQKLKESINLSR